VRVVEGLNAALHDLLAGDPGAYLLGEDVADPYGGAFKATRGLSTRFPDRVLSTPISENAVTGVACGLALTGHTVVVEMMFGDFVTLALDQLVNFAGKSVTMYGRPQPLRLIVRCPTGGGRGYGPTHSQSLQKHLIGWPGVTVWELSPFHPCAEVLDAIVAAGLPAVLMEDKVLYTRPFGPDDELFTVTRDGDLAIVDLVPDASQPPSPTPDCLIIAPGGVAHRALAAMRHLLLESETICRLVVPARLHPLPAERLLPYLGRAVVVAEDSTAGGTWGAEVAHGLHQVAWPLLSGPVQLAHALDSVVPAAPHLEQLTMLGPQTVVEAVRRALDDAPGPAIPGGGA
jgi:pyruvate dehydrogenase E1 component beta subunit